MSDPTLARPISHLIRTHAVKVERPAPQGASSAAAVPSALGSNALHLVVTAISLWVLFITARTRLRHGYTEPDPF